MIWPEHISAMFVPVLTDNISKYLNKIIKSIKRGLICFQFQNLLDYIYEIKMSKNSNLNH